MSASLITAGSKTAVFIDLNGMTPATKDGIAATLTEAYALISSQVGGCYVITDLTNSVFNPELVESLSQFVSGNSPYVKESILFGVDDQHLLIVSIFKKLHKRTFVLKDSLADATAYVSAAE